MAELSYALPVPPDLLENMPDRSEVCLNPMTMWIKSDRLLGIEAKIVFGTKQQVDRDLVKRYEKNKQTNDIDMNQSQKKHG